MKSGRSIIDIMIGTPCLATRISDWSILEGTTLSDNQCIELSLQEQSQTVDEGRGSAACGMEDGKGSFDASLALASRSRRVGLRLNSATIILSSLLDVDSVCPFPGSSSTVFLSLYRSTHIFTECLDFFSTLATADYERCAPRAWVHKKKHFVTFSVDSTQSIMLCNI